MEIKTKIIIALAIICILLGYLWIAHPKIVEKKTTEWRVLDAIVTGATNATIAPDGAVIASGPNISIKKHEEEKKTDNTKYSYSLLMAGGQINTLGDYGVNVMIKLDNFTLGVDYDIKRQIWGIRADVVLLSW